MRYFTVVVVVVVECIYKPLRHMSVATKPRFFQQRAQRPWLVFTARRYASTVYAVVMCLSVCLTVCVSVTLRCCVKAAKHSFTQTKLHDRPGI